MASNRNGKDTDDNSKPTGTPGLNYVNIIFLLLEHTVAFFSLGLLTTRPWNLNTAYLFFGLFILTTFSITGGYHRFYAHGSFQANPLFKLLIIIFGASAFLGPITSWVRYHRAHHRFHGKQLDPMCASKGLWYAHMGWMCVIQPDATYASKIDISDIEKDKYAATQAKMYYLIAALSGLIWPTLLAGLWNDQLGGFLYAGVLRIVLVQHAICSTTSFGHLLGLTKYSDGAKNNIFVAICALGEGYQNFHHNFPKDYRVGPKFYDFDPTKWIIAGLSMIGWTSDLKTTKSMDIKKAHLLYKQQILDRKKTGLDFGPEEKDLPVENWETFQNKVKKGQKLIVIDGIIHDASQFIRIHPGGIKILEKRIGKDATIAFNGGLYRHSKAARNILATLRVAKLPLEEIHVHTESDHFRADDE